MPIQADISNEKEIKNMVDIAIKEFGRINVLVNNAGIVIDREFEDRTVEDWKKTLDINLIAPFVLTKLVGKEMMKQKSGAASKSGLISLTYDSAVQFAPYVRVNCVAAGWVNTEMNKELPEDLVREETEKILVKRFAEPKEIAKVVTFLASEDASFVNSTVIKVDGGWY